MISCASHDYIEIACMYQLSVRLTLRQGKHIEGIAENSFTDKDKKEYLLLKTDADKIKIELDDISSMQAITANPHFDLVTF